VSSDTAELRDRAEWMLRPLFREYQVLEFNGGTIFRGPVSRYCELHRAEVEKGLRQLPGGHCFEQVGDTHTLTCTIPGAGAKPVNRVLHAGLFAATVFTTLVAGAEWRFDEFLAELGSSLLGVADSMSLGELFGALVTRGGPFAAAIMVIFGAHEMGHYLMARRYGMLVTPPFFLPGPPPIPPFGTFGAIIKIRSPIMHRRSLFDIGVAGPVAGLVFTFPILIYGLAHSQFEIIRTWEPGGAMNFGHSLLTWGLTRLLVGVPEPGYMLNWLAHPMAWAGWLGLLITALNLMPVGQLDGGHVAYALFGPKQRLVAYFAFGVLIALAFRFQAWVVWCVVMALWMRPAHPPVVIEEVRLDPVRRALAWAAMVLLVLVFMPAPVVGLD